MASFKKKQHKTLAIIPARGGSKSIPKKNIFPLAGRPLISYAIRAAKKAGSVDRVIVSTDSPEIAAVARRYGAETPFLRPSELAKDTTPTIPVLTHALQDLEDREQYRPDYILLLQPTEPFVKSRHIDEAFQLLISKRADSVTTVIEVPRIFHPYHVRMVNKKGFLQFEYPQRHYAHPSRQLDPKRYAFGNLYWFSRDLLMKKGKVEGGRQFPLVIDALLAHDINGHNDVILAEFLLKNKFV